MATAKRKILVSLARAALLCACIALTAAPARADEAPRLPSELYVPAPGLATLLPPAPADLAARIERLRARLEAAAADPTALALDTFAHERLVFWRDTLAPPPAGAPSAPDHARSLALLEALDPDALDEATRTEVLLALGLARATSRERGPRRQAAPALREALQRLPLDDAERRAAAALALAELLADAGEPSEAGAVLEQVDEVAGNVRYDALVTWQRAELALARSSAPSAEKHLYRLVHELADSGRIDSLDPALLERIVVALAEAGAGREDGWVRTHQALERLRSADLARLFPQLVATYDRGGLPMNRARIRLYGGTAELTAPDAVVGEVEVVVAAAEALGGPAATQLCAEGLALVEARASAAASAVEGLVTRCLEVYLAAPRDTTRPEIVLALYDPLLDRHAHLLRPVDRAHYGMALLDSGQTGFAREQLLGVDIEALPEGERVGFARAAAQLRHATNKDIRLEELSCTLRRRLPLPQEDVRYQGWLETALGASSDAQERYTLNQMALAALLMNGHYEDALARLETLLEVGAGFDEAALESDVGHVLRCLARAGRWSELTAVTPVLRRGLSADVRDRVFERHGATLTDAHLDLANALDLSGRTEDAVRLLLDLQRTWRSNPQVPELLFATGALLAASGEAHRAMTYYEQIFEEFATHELADDALFAAANALRTQGDVLTARMLLERITTGHSTGEYPQRAQEILEQLDDAETPADAP